MFLDAMLTYLCDVATNFVTYLFSRILATILTLPFLSNIFDCQMAMSVGISTDVMIFLLPETITVPPLLRVRCSISMPHLLNSVTFFQWSPLESSTSSIRRKLGSQFSKKIFLGPNTTFLMKTVLADISNLEASFSVCVVLEFSVSKYSRHKSFIPFHSCFRCEITN